MGPLELHLKIQKTDLTETLMEFYQCRLNEMCFFFFLEGLLHHFNVFFP